MKVTDSDIDEIRASNGIKLVNSSGGNIVEKAWVAPALHAPHGGDATITALEGRNLREGVHRGEIACAACAAPADQTAVRLTCALMKVASADFREVIAHGNDAQLEVSPAVNFAGCENTAYIAHGVRPRRS